MLDTLVKIPLKVYANYVYDVGRLLPQTHMVVPIMVAKSIGKLVVVPEAIKQLESNKLVLKTVRSVTVLIGQ